MDEPFHPGELEMSAARGCWTRRGPWSERPHRVATNAALMLRRARSRRPAESLEAFLPRFDAAGVHAATPADLQVAAEAGRLLDQRLAGTGSSSNT
jgi:hypothetical protein